MTNGQNVGRSVRIVILISKWPNYSVLRELVLWSLFQVLFVDVRLRLVTDIGILWQSVVNSLDGYFTIGLQSRPECHKPAVNQYDVMPS